ncbi:hypothetical protein AvCA_22680 [Azotobacter vinelandii CA]|uniref:Uncharacterized protein n=2 Tax=Azotobacter vinelandii TaxID=354 RepID=C1DGE8_AZOVD|nr:hypothetical protein [Azotobacter vinelandii]ACO78459.1 hypothetical protein Avin_22680 [Azotobacter vinelandii DJ]AGK15001.1 hypothetical protein AvCA_22680 [Azotobacter vinelandii CA]AGK20525.1 hypothetical protein AvCA6_22680 [Azotobacter vinelandii CA6]WKN24155.1 hypothetical protein AVAEIV_002297 [Azotobacter vinelandii]SFY18248.1 hypothetical protein SAMN04244547_04341 [Azotobacter vinelandii]
MFHIIPFAVGVATGAALLKLLKSEKTQEGLDKAQGGLREATVSSLQAIEKASARARARLGEKAEAESGETPVGEAPHLSEEEAATARAAAEPATGAQGAQGGTGGGEHHHWTASESLENLEGGKGGRAP